MCFQWDYWLILTLTFSQFPCIVEVAPTDDVFHLSLHFDRYVGEKSHRLSTQLTRHLQELLWHR